MPAASNTSLRVRRALVLIVSAVVPFVLVRVGGHRGVHMARNLLFPGAGVLDHQPLLAAVCAVTAIAATVLWIRWGAGWVLLGVVLLTTAISGLVSPGHVNQAAAFRKVSAAHEFPLVILVMGALAWARTILGRLPGLRAVTRRRHQRRTGIAQLGVLKPVERCQAAAILSLAGARDIDLGSAVGAADIARRAGRVGAVARLRFGGDPFRRDHAHARAAQLLCGLMDDNGVEQLAMDASATTLGVPCSEPTWIRPLDATLVAAALSRAGNAQSAEHWSAALNGPMALRRGHRPAWWWTPLDIGAGGAPTWEHAAFTGIARAHGWIGGDDWAVLRTRAMGAAARGAVTRDDERLVAASRIWLALEEDPEAARIVRRPGIRRDPLACALDRLASELCQNPDVLRGITAGTPDGGDLT